jgi:polyphosphate kinase
MAGDVEFSLTIKQRGVELGTWTTAETSSSGERHVEQYTKAKEEMLERTNIPEAPWSIVEGNDKKQAWLNCIHHLLQQIAYADVPRDPITLPDRVFNRDIERKVLTDELCVPKNY